MPQATVLDVHAVPLKDSPGPHEQTNVWDKGGGESTHTVCLPIHVVSVERAVKMGQKQEQHQQQQHQPHKE